MDFSDISPIYIGTVAVMPPRQVPAIRRATYRCQTSVASKSLPSWWWTVWAGRRLQAFGRSSQRSCQLVWTWRWRRWRSGNPTMNPGQQSSWSSSSWTTAWASPVTSMPAPSPRRTDRPWLHWEDKEKLVNKFCRSVRLGHNGVVHK